MEIDSDDDVIAFVDKYIVPTENEQLKDLVRSRQTHHLTRICKKKKRLNCRFNFSKIPIRNNCYSSTANWETSKTGDGKCQKGLNHLGENTTGYWH